MVGYKISSLNDYSFLFFKTSSQFLKDLKNRTRNAKTYASFAYDAVWTLAFALDKASKTMDLSKFNYTQQKIAKNISKLVEDVKFEAVSVSSDFINACLNPPKITQSRKSLMTSSIILFNVKMKIAVES